MGLKFSQPISLKFWHKRIMHAECKQKEMLIAQAEECAQTILDYRAPPPNLRALADITYFNNRQLKALYRDYKAHCINGWLTHANLTKALKGIFVTGDPTAYARCLLNAAAGGEHVDKIDFASYAQAMSTLTHGTPDEKWAFVFKLIDVDCDGEITSANLRSYLAAIHCLGSIKESTYRAIGEQLGRLCKSFNLMQPSSVLTQKEFIAQMLSTQTSDQLEIFVATI